MASEYTIDREDAVSVANVIREKAEIEGKLVWPDGWKTAIQGISGGGLNFEVVGGTVRPEKPKENTIWVETDTGITGWIFSGSEPTNMADGSVWFGIAGSSPVSFNALRENEIRIKAASAHQYVSGAFIPVLAKIYQGGVWIPWVLWLYEIGNLFGDLTGGWKCVLSGGTGVRFISGNIEFYIVSSGGRDAAVFTKNRIALKGYTKLCASVTASNHAERFGKFNLGISSTNTEYYPNYVAKSTVTSAGHYQLELDISGIVDDSYYVALSADVSTGYVYKVWAE